MCTINNSSVDIQALRRALGQFPTGVAVVTTAPKGMQPVGMTINSFQSISLEPALVGWCIDRRAGSYRTFCRSGEFTLSFLDETQRHTAEHFACKGADKFRGLDTSDPAGAVIPGTCAWLRCRLYRQIPLGDHLMLVGEVTDFGTPGGRPMIFALGQFGFIGRPYPRELSQPAAAA